MVRSKKKSSAGSRETKKAEREVRRQFAALGIDSPPGSPTRQRMRPRKVSAAESGFAEPAYRKLVDYLVKSAMSKFELIDYQPPDDLSMGDYFSLEEFVKVFKITFVQTDLWFVHWKEFFRKHYCTMMRERDAYLEHLFVGLNCIYARNRPLLENLLAAHSFVVCATVYFSYNGWPQALAHPVRVLTSHFESQLRLPFFEIGGFRGLAKFCEGHELLKMYSFYWEWDITPENEMLNRDIKSRVRREVHDILEEYDRRLSYVNDTEVSIQKTIAWVHYSDMEVKLKRNVGNEWKFKDIHVGTVIMKRMDDEQRKIDDQQRMQEQRSPKRVLETIHEEEPVRRPPLVDEKVLEDLKKILENFDLSIFELEKKAESLLE